MKYFPLLLFFVLCFAFAVSAQTNQTSSCPIISVTGSGDVRAGEPMIFTANVELRELKAISYQWTISNGTIISGQETPVIKVDTTGPSNEKLPQPSKSKDCPKIVKTSSPKAVRLPSAAGFRSQLIFMENFFS